MKRLVSSLLLLMIVVVGNTTTITLGQRAEVNGIYYYIQIGTAVVTSNSEHYSGDIVIPSEITFNNSKYIVTSIGYNAFGSCSELTSITIPNSVTSIGKNAFEGCSSLTSVIIPNSVTSIGIRAFAGCNPTSITVESGNTIYDSRDNCNAIIETSSNTLIYGFNNTIIPNSVTSIGDGAFSGCNGLTSVTIPNSVTSIGNSAFYGCSGLTSVTIPNSVTSIGNSAFQECSGLTSVAISNSVTFIGDGAFSGCSGLTSVTIPNSMTSIGNSAFEGCSSLSSITFSNSITNIGEKAFLNTGWYNNQSDGPLFLNKWLLGYKGDYPKGKITIPNGIKGIAKKAFYDCKDIYSVTIPYSVTDIGDYAFAGCYGLTDFICYAEVPPSAIDIFSSGITIKPIVLIRKKKIPFSKVDISKVTLYVPNSSLSVYKETSPWSDFGNIVSLESTTDFKGYNGRTWMVGNYAPVRFDFADINAAMASSMVKDGDILLTFDSSVSGDQTVTKSVKIVGQRIYENWNSATIQNLNIEAPDVTVVNLRVQKDINVRDEHAMIEHCNVSGSILSGYNYDCDNATIRSCYIYGTVDDSNGYGWTITNSYVHGQETGFTTGYSELPADLPVFSEFVREATAKDGESLRVPYLIYNVNSLKLIEYFWDTDPGWTKAYMLKNAPGNYVVNGLKEELTVSTNGLSVGQHTLVVRACSNSGYWTLGTMKVTIEAQAQPDPKPVFSYVDFPSSGVNNNYRISFSVAAEGGLIDWVEYYWDKDPGLKKGHVIVEQNKDSGSGITLNNYLVDSGGLTGKHTLYLRAFCGTQWAQVYIKEIELTAPVVEHINADDLKALRLISDNLHLNGYWNFANEGREESNFPGVTFLDHRVIEIDLSNHAFTGTLSDSWMPALSEITLLNLSRNNIDGDITPLVAKMPKLKTLDISHNRIMKISGTLPASLTTFNARSQMRTFGNSSSGADEKFIDLILSGAISPTTAPIGSEVSLALPTLFYYNAKKNDNSLRADIQVVDINSPTTIYGTYSYNGQYSGWKFTPQLSSDMSFQNEKQVALVSTGQWQQWSAYPALLSVLLGDANIDGMVDVLDVQHTLNYILATAQPFNYWAANTYMDKTINVQDIVCTVNIMLGLPNNARHSDLARSIDRKANDTTTDIQCWVYEQNGRIALTSTTGIAALDIEVEGASTDEVSLLLNHRDFKMIGQNTANGSRYVIFSPTGATIPANKAVPVLALSHSTTPVAVRCADSTAHAVGTTISMPTGISEVHGGNESRTIIETYLAPGIYIVRTTDADGNSKTRKILKK